MTEISLEKSSIEDTDAIVSFLISMSSELDEFKLDEEVAERSVRRSFDENVIWFLFKDSTKKAFGTCYLQSVHNYWRLEKRFYLGGFYISPSYRKKGYFKVLNEKLIDWAKEHDGVQIYTHIHKDNGRSIGAFQSTGMEHIDYILLANHWGK